MLSRVCHASALYWLACRLLLLGDLFYFYLVASRLDVCTTVPGSGDLDCAFAQWRSVCSQWSKYRPIAAIDSWPLIQLK